MLDFVNIKKETRILPKNIENVDRTEWGCAAYFSSFSSVSRGVIIFINNNFRQKVHKLTKDICENLLMLDKTI